MGLVLGRMAILVVVVLVGLSAPAVANESQDGIAYAERQLRPYASQPVFRAPGDPFDVRACAKAKSMLSIPNPSANPFLKGIIDRMKRVGAEVGFKVIEWENQGQPSQWV